MTIRHLRASITRLVLVGAMAAAVAAGSVAIGPSHEAAAMTKYQFCEGLASAWWDNFNLGHYDKANAIAGAYAAFC
jgi:cytochrome c1